MLSFFIAALPALFMWEVVAIKVNIRLPKPLRKKLFKTGARFGILALIIELCEHAVPLDGLPPVTHAFCEAFFMAALPEELVKFAGVYRFSRKELDEIGPGIAILLAVGISLGFAVFENKLYVLGGGFVVWVVRALTAVPMHAIWGLIMGSFFTLAWRDYKGTDYRMLVLAIAVPMLFHFSYDFLLMLHDNEPALLWPSDILPAVMLVQGVFAMILTNHAVNGQTAIYGVRVPSDPTGTRAGLFAFFMVLIIAGFVYLHFQFPDAEGLPMLATVPVILTLDLCLIALARHSPGR